MARGLSPWMRRAELSSLEIGILSAEIAEKIRNSRVANVYRMPDASYLIRFTSEEGRRDLRIVPNKCLFLVEGVYEAHGELDEFARSLREFLKGLYFKDARPVEGERIISMVFGLREPIFSLVVELFPGGHIVLMDAKGIVKASHPSGMVGKQYSPPEPRKTIIDPEVARDILCSVDGNVKIGLALARDLGLGPKYSDEVLVRAGVASSLRVSSCVDDLLEKVLSALKSLMDDLGRTSPRIYAGDDLAVPAPFILKSLEELGFRSEEVGSFNEAVWKSYESLPSISQDLAEKEAERLEKELLDKRQLVSKLESESEKKRRLAETIFNNLSVIEEARLSVLAGGSSSNVTNIDWDEGTFMVKIGEEFIKLLIREPASRQASSLFNDAKMMRKGIENIKAEIEEIGRKLEEVKSQKATLIVTPSVKASRKKEWYENYRWSYTSGGRLVVAGKDAATNIKLLKKHLEDRDMVFHAEVKGSPVVILKGGRDAAQEELEEAATFCAAYSRAWREGLSAVSVYMVPPEQVSFSPPPGTYLPRGSFIVKPPKTYFQVSLRLCIGLSEEPRRLIVGHERWVSSAAKTYLSLIPGNKSGEEIARTFVETVKERLGIELSREEVEEFKSLIPFGKGQVAK